MEDGRWVQVGLGQLGVPNANLDPTATQLEQQEEPQTLTSLRTSPNPEVVSTSNSKQQTGTIYQQEYSEIRSQFLSTSTGAVVKWSRIAVTKRLLSMTMQPRIPSMLDRMELYVVQTKSK